MCVSLNLCFRFYCEANCYSLMVLHGQLLCNQDFGVWNISYQSVACTNWEGWNHAAALGSVTSLGSSACCPDNPTVGLPALFLH